MSVCPSCGHGLDDSRPTPPHCPACGLALPASPVGAPPGFAGRPGDSGSATIFTPAESSTNLPRTGLQPPRRRQPPPPPTIGGAAGPPSIGLGDLGSHNELDLGPGASGSGLQLDHEPPPGVQLPEDSGLDLSLAGDDGSDPAADLPSPVGAAGRPGRRPAPFAPPPRPGVPPPPQPFSPPPADPMADLPSPKAPPPPRRPFGAPPTDPTADLPQPVGAAGRPAAHDFDPTSDLPGLPNTGADPAADLPGLRGQAPAGHADPTADLPGLRGQANRAAPAHPGGAAAGFSSGADPSADLPGLRSPGAEANPSLVDLPAPVDQARAAFADDLPVPVDLDLPTPVAGNRAAGPAVGGSIADDLDLPIPAEMGVTPAGQEVAPTEMGVTPADQDVVPMMMDVEPKLGGDELTPRAATPQAPNPKSDALQLDRGAMPGQGTGPTGAAGVGASESSASEAGPATATPSTPTPAPPVAANDRPAVSRGVKLLGGGLLVVGLAGAGVMYSGLLDPTDPEPTTQRGMPKKGGKASSDGANGAEGGSPTTVPSGPAVARSEAVLAEFAKHTPAGYLAAKTAASEAGDAVGMAEAQLLLHYHFGPNLARATEAGTILGGVAGSTEPFVTRVLGLAALAAGNLEGAEASLAGDDPRARMYRGWLRLAQARLDDAQAEADAVAKASPTDRGAVHLRLAIAAKRDPAAGLAAIETELAKSPGDPALAALQARTALEAGTLATARKAIAALDPATSDDPGIKAWMELVRAEVAFAQGDHRNAIAAYDRALEGTGNVASLQAARIRALLAGKRFNDAAASASRLARENPNDLELQLLHAKVAVETGDGDIALQVLDTLTAAAPQDHRVPLYRGEVHAMRMAVDDGKAAFEQARGLAPDSIDVAIAEAKMLAAAKQLDAANSILDTAHDAAQKAGRTADVAALLLAKARLALAAGQRPQAIAALDGALAAQPGNNDAQILRGTIKLEDGKTAAGQADLIAVFERTGGYPGLAAPLGRLYVAAGDYASLEKLVGDQIRGADTRDDLLAIGARLRLYQGRTADARALLQAALSAHPTDWEAQMLMAQVLLAEGRPAEALAQIETARPPTPQAELMLQRGKVFEFNAKHNDAMPEYQKALGLAPNLHEARFLYGRLLGFSGANSRAITELTLVANAEGAKSAPWYPEVWLAIGRAQQGLGKSDDAIASLGQATTLKPDFGEAYAEQGRIYGFRNQSGKAISALQQAKKLGSASDHWYPGALMALGRAQAKAGKASAAKETLGEFLKIASPEDSSRAEAERLVREL